MEQSKPKLVDAEPFNEVDWNTVLPVDGDYRKTHSPSAAELLPHNGLLCRGPPKTTLVGAGLAGRKREGDR